MKKKFRVVKKFKIVKRFCSLNRYYRVIKLVFQFECPNLNLNLEWVSNHFYKSNLTALKKQNPLVNAVTTKITKKMNLNPPALLCILTALSVSSECSSSRPAMFVIGTWAVSLGTVTATFGGPSKSFRKACN